MDFDTCLVCQVLQFEFLGFTSPDIGVSLLARISSFWSNLVILADGSLALGKIVELYAHDIFFFSVEIVSVLPGNRQAA